MTDWLRGLGLSLLLLVGCSGSRLVSRFPVETIPVPERAASYLSSPRPDGATGGPGAGKLARQVADALSERGQKAESDGALASAACFALDRVHRGHPPDPIMMEAASRRFGFGGVISSFIAFDAQTDVWRDQLEQIPQNLPLNRFGVCVSPSGRSADLVLGALEMQYDTVPKDLEPGQQATMRGRVGPRFTSAHVYLTKADGSVDERPMTTRDVDASFQLDAPGQYRLEVMGDGPTGPVIVSNLPLYVGVAEPAILESTGVIVEPEVAEARMFDLLNEARRLAGVAPLVRDDDLRRVAEGHSEDMRDHNFFSHVSPSTGAPQDRLRRSGLLVSIFGENIASAPTPEDAHRGLMDSPGHRANMLNPKFTNVGIAATKSSVGLIVTLNFGRRPRAEDLPRGEQVQAAFVELRSSAGLTTPGPDPVYSAGAQAGADATAAGSDEADVAKAEGAAMQREVNRLRTSRSNSCVFRAELLELEQLKQFTPLLSPQLRRFGIGTHLRRDAKGTRLSTVIMLEGVPCH
ncbi:MAG: CAP domain-containing protein [Myxococcales bacterium]